jgi:hypothetical protein
LTEADYASIAAWDAAEAQEARRDSGDHHSGVIRLSTPIGPHGEWHLR